jgi:hypothetical protein
MERKFESELAGQVARHHKNPIGNRAKVLFMTVISCAVMVGAAAAVLSMDARATLGTPTDYTPVFDGEDYLEVNAEGEIAYAEAPETEDVFLMKRTSELKWTTWDTPGNSPIDYTKVAYMVNLKLKDTTAFTSGVTSMSVTDLTVGGFGLSAPTLASASISINDVAVLMTDGGLALDASEYITWVYNEATGVLSVEVTLPSLDLTNALSYKDGDKISIFVMFKTSETLSTITGSEIGFPFYNLDTV